MAEQLPVWNNPGIEPSVDLKTNGWQPGQKPSAQHFNWLFNRAYKCLEDLQNNKADKTAITNLSQTLSDLEESFTSHLADDVKHITTAERSNWNSKAPGNHNHNGVYEPVLEPERKRKITFGTANPTGGSDGDIYFQYE